MRALTDKAVIWHGGELWRREGCVHGLSPEEIDELRLATAAVSGLSIPLEAVERADFPLPLLAKRLAAAATTLENGPGVFLLRGVPVARYCENEAARLFWGLARYLGTPVSQSAAGGRFFKVRDEGFAMAMPRRAAPIPARR